MAAVFAAILDFTQIRHYHKTAEINFFDTRHVEYDIIKHFASFLSIFCDFITTKGKKHAFLLKNGLTNCYL